MLRGTRPQIGVAYWPEFRAPWGVGFKRDWAVFHIVAQGTCWLHLKGWKEPASLSEGDFAVVCSAQLHTMQDSPSTPAVDFADLIRTLSPDKKGAWVRQRRPGGGLLTATDSRPNRVDCSDTILNALRPKAVRREPIRFARRDAEH